MRFEMIIEDRHCVWIEQLLQRKSRSNLLTGLDASPNLPTITLGLGLGFGFGLGLGKWFG